MLSSHDALCETRETSMRMETSDESGDGRGDRGANGGVKGPVSPQNGVAFGTVAGTRSVRVGARLQHR